MKALKLKSKPVAVKMLFITCMNWRNILKIMGEDAEDAKDAEMGMGQYL